MIDLLLIFLALLWPEKLPNDGCDRDGCSPVPKPPK